jgi:3-hydroxybutyryl-CoA dehydrogenase
MGLGIAYVFAASGWKVTMVEPSAERANALPSLLADSVSRSLQRGKISGDSAATLASSVTIAQAVADLTEHFQLAIETVPERLELKRTVIQELDQLSPDVLASNTSSFSINDLALATMHPESFVGMHFFNPVWSLDLVEIIRGSATSDNTLEITRRIVQSIGKQPIVVSDTPGFATSRLDLIAALEAMRMLEAGVATAEDIDRAMTTAYRHPIGPLRLSDVVGLDVRLDIARSLEQSLGDRYAPPQILIDLVAAGRLGKKSGQGFYDWSEPEPRPIAVATGSTQQSNSVGTR